MPDLLDLDAIERRNNERRQLKAVATPLQSQPGWSEDAARWFVSREFAHGGAWFVHGPGANRQPAVAYCSVRADAELFAHARNDFLEDDVDAMLAECHRLRTELATAKAAAFREAAEIVAQIQATKTSGETIEAMGEAIDALNARVALVRETCAGEDGPDTYSWDVGIPP